MSNKFWSREELAAAVKNLHELDGAVKTKSLRMLNDASTIPMLRKAVFPNEKPAYEAMMRSFAEKKRKLDFDNPEDAPVNLVKKQVPSEGRQIQCARAQFKQILEAGRQAWLKCHGPRGQSGAEPAPHLQPQMECSGNDQGLVAVLPAHPTPQQEHSASVSREVQQHEDVWAGAFSREDLVYELPSVDGRIGHFNGQDPVNMVGRSDEAMLTRRVKRMLQAKKLLAADMTKRDPSDVFTDARSDVLGLQGPMGSGKSYLITALAVDLYCTVQRVAALKEKVRIVAVLNHGRFVASKAANCDVHLREQLYLAYGSDSEVDYLRRQQLATLRGFENVTRWILNSTCQETLVFLIDNLAEEGLEGRANHNPHGLENFISRVARHHIVIKAISPTSHAVPAGDYGPPITVSSRCPTEGFSRRCLETLLKERGFTGLTEEQLQQMDFLTGSIPLLLHEFCRSFVQDFPQKDVKDRFEAVVEGWASLSLVGNMMARLRQWARQHAETPDGRNFLGQLLAGGSIAVSKKAFVQELLFVDPLNFKARLSAGCGRQVVSRVLFDSGNAQWARSFRFLEQLHRSVKDPAMNRTMLGWLVEVATLGVMQDMGPLWATPCKVFNGPVYVEEVGKQLLIPSALNYPHLDAILRTVTKSPDNQAKVKVSAYQITIAPESHASSAASFFSRDVAGKWIEPSIQFHRKVLPEFEFVWICPQGIHPAQPPQRRNLRSTSHLDYSEGVTRAETPSKRAYVEKWLSFAAIHPNLAFLDNLSKPS